jgi:hypothetical protein
MKTGFWVQEMLGPPPYAISFSDTEFKVEDSAIFQLLDYGSPDVLAIADARSHRKAMILHPAARSDVVYTRLDLSDLAGIHPPACCGQ